MNVNVQSIDINLMMQTERQADRNHIGAIILVMIALIGIAVPVWLRVEAQTEIKSLQHAIAEVNENIQVYQGQQVEQPVTISFANYLSLPAELKDFRPQLTIMLEQLTTFLPVEVNVHSLSYTDGGKIRIDASFGDYEKLVTFIRHVNEAEHFTITAINHVTNERDEQLFGIEGGLIEKLSHELPVSRTVFELEYNPPVLEGSGGE